MDATKSLAAESKDTQIDTEKCKDENGNNKPLDLKMVQIKSDAKKCVSFENQSVKKDDSSSGPPPATASVKDSAVSPPPIVKCGSRGAVGKYFVKKESDTDEYEDYDEMDDDGDSIPCSQMRDVPHMLQQQNACCNFDVPYQPLNLNHLNSPKEDESQDNDEDQEEQDTEENGSQKDSNNGSVIFPYSLHIIL